MADPGQQIFLSYSREDVVFARKLREWLVAQGHRPWMDLFDIPAGARWPDEIDRALRAADVVMGLMSPASVASENVKNEWDWAIANGRRLVLLLVESCDVPFHYVSRNYLDFTDDRQDECWRQLERALTALSEGGRAARAAPSDAGSSGPRRRQRPAVAVERPVQVGRDVEREALAELLSETLGGQGRAILIGGEAGIGKTTLVTDLAVTASEQGALVLRGGCYDLTTTPPYGPWIEITRAYPDSDDLPELPRPLREGEDLAAIRSQRALFELAADFLLAVADTRPLVLLLEDLHWADEASLDLLRYLARLVAGARLLLVATYRDDELTRRDQLYRLLPLLVREAGAERLSLRRLDRGAVAALIERRYDLPEDQHMRLVDHLLKTAEGNPFFTGEILQSLETDDVLARDEDGWRLSDLSLVSVPPLVRQVIEGRLAGLEEETRGALELAAVIGHEAPFDLWQAVSGLPDDQLLEIAERVIEARLLEESAGDRLVFVHALIREALYDGIMRIRRRMAHRQVAEALVEQPRPDPDAVAHHFQQAGDERAAGWLIQAGERARHAYAWLTAVDRYEAALDLLADDHERAQERGWLLYRVGVLLRANDPRRSSDYLGAARQIAGEVGDRTLLAYSAFMQGAMQCFAAEIEAGIEQMAAGVTMLDGLTVDDLDQCGDLLTTLWVDSGPRQVVPSDELLRINPGLGTYALWLASAGRYDDVLALREPSASVPENGAASIAAAHSLSDFHLARGWTAASRGEPERAGREISRALEGYAAIHHYLLYDWAVLLKWHGLILPYYADDPVARGEVRLAAEGLHEYLGDLYRGGTENLAEHSRVEVHATMGEWGSVIQGLQAATQAGHGSIRHRARILLARIYHYQGDDAAALTLIRQVLPDGLEQRPGTIAHSPTIETQRLAAALALDRGDLETARSWLEANDRWLDWANATRGRAGGRLLWACYHQASGDEKGARKQARRALAHASDPRQPLALLAIHRFLGGLDTAEGRYAEAEDHLEQSRQLADACEIPIERALTLLELARLRVATGRAGDARALLGEVRAICERLAAQPTLDRVAEMEENLDAVAG